MKKILASFVMGIGLGQFFYITCLYLFKGGPQSPQTILLVALISGFMGLTGRIYELPKLSLWLKSILHFALIAVLVATVNLVMGNTFYLSLGAFLGLLVSFAILYLVIWCAIYLIEKKKIEAINEKLR